MPSQAFSDYQDNLKDVDRLLDNHERLSDTPAQTRGLGHLTRAGILLLSAAWELYTESLLVEGVEIVCTRISLPDGLPLSVQKRLSRQVKSAEHELKPLTLAGAGWKDVYLAYATEATEGLHTPNPANLDSLYENYLGVELLSDQWFVEKARLEEFVEDRGKIAHRGRDAKYVRIDHLKSYREDVYQLAIDTDNFITDHIEDITSSGKPWDQIEST